MNDQHYDPFTEKKKGLFHRNEEAAETKENNAKAMAEALNENLQNETSDVHAHEANTQREVEEAPKAEALSMGEESKTATEGAAQGFEATQPQYPKPSRRRYSHPVSAMVVAGFWIRTVAFLIDAAVASAFAAIFASPINALLLTEGGLAAKAISGFFFYLYFILSTYFTNGQSLGKIITAIRVIHPEEDRLSLTTVVIREGFCRLIQTTFVLLYVITAFSERKRNLGDYLSDTYVVKDALYLVEKKEGDLFYAYEN
ncbi:RDD family protein [Peptoniphilus sp. HCN-40583]|uniref:RDD family protein n=1 Tax=Peptoniphilus sp. HCN-40583 TaxID=3134662 RepID=UPI0030BFF4DC